MNSSALQPKKENACALCNLPLPSKPVRDEKGRSYCCHGCAHVAAILEEVGTESEAGRRALAAARQSGLISTDEEPKQCQSRLPDTVREDVRMRVEGLACPSCGWLVESVLTTQKGVVRAEVDYLSDTVSIEFDLSKTSRDELAEAVADAGYRLSGLEEEGRRGETTDLIRFALAAVVAMNQMVLAWVGYGAFFSNTVDTWALLVGWVQLIAAVPVVTWAAMPLYRRALAAIARGRVVMETLLSLGVLAATGLSAWSIISGQAHTYLETATMLVALSLGGRELERFLKRASAKSLTDLLQFSPSKARRDGDGRFAPLGEFKENDLIRVEAGETVPLDLRAGGDCVVREGMLTGEPHPVARRRGDLILAGSVVEKGPLVGRVDRPAGETAADTIRERVASALRRADAGSRLADRLAQGFVPLVIIVALSALTWHLLAGAGPERAGMIAVAVLVVSCPCAFGVAASSALSLAVLRLANTGVLLKEPATLEKARDTDTVIFDKTGTLTRGELTLAHIGWLGAEQRALLDGIRAIEANSSHPFGLALSRLLPDHNPLPPVVNVIEVPGMGATGTVHGRRLAVGKADLFAESAYPLPSPRQGASRIWFGEAGEQPAGYADLADELRSEALGVVNELHERGLETELLSGDAHEATTAKASEASIPKAKGGLKPEEKAARVEELRSQGRRIAFVGDGFNDAEALAAADVGIAMASGADLALVSAPVVITNGGLNGVTELFDVARKATSVLKSNFIWAFAYNIALLPVAAMGWLAPVWAAALMAISSASVGLNSMRLRYQPAAGDE